MAFLGGYSQPSVTMASGGPTASGASISNADARASVAIDGTPVRVVVLAFAAAAGLTALRWAGFKFNVAASS
jgi:hypothetical protein